MKELSVEEKAKAYDEAIEKSKEFYILCKKCGAKDTVDFLEDSFPELKESEDEKIRKVLKHYLEVRRCQTQSDEEYINCNNFLAWLEKQGEQKFPIEKFREGEWVVFNDKHESVYQIEKIENFQYTLRHILGGSMPLSFSGEDMIRPWAIQDARDGDVLACNEEILLFKSYSVQGRISLYCWYNGQTNNFHSKEVVDTLMTTRNKIYPATKEQRDLLFQKMKEAGYTFDFEKKELKKISQRMISAEAKEAMYGQPAWSEEDEEMFEYTISLLNYNLGCRKWLKSLKERYIWKPSDEQITVLELASKYERVFTPKQIDILIGLKEQLKKLKG